MDHIEKLTIVRFFVRSLIFQFGIKKEKTLQTLIHKVFYTLVPHIGELSNQYKEELQLLYRLKPLFKPNLI